MATTSNYPGALDTLQTPAANLSGPPTHEDIHLEIRDAVHKIQTELGVNPGKAYAVIQTFNEEDTTVVNTSTLTDIGSPITFVPPTGWVTYSLAVVGSARVVIPAGVNYQVGVRPKIDATATPTTPQVGSNPFGSAVSAHLLCEGAVTGLSGTVDTQLEAFIDQLSSGTGLSVTRVQGHLLATRIS